MYQEKDIIFAHYWNNNMEDSGKFNFLFSYKKLLTNEVQVGDTPLGGNNPIRIQSMTNTDTRDVHATTEQCIRIIMKGADYVRITVPSVRDNEYLMEIHDLLRQRGFSTPLVADIHFNPLVAEQAAAIVEKVRINPGNFSGTNKKVFTDEEYVKEQLQSKEKFIRLLDICKKHNTAIRIGVNHGSLSGRIINKFGDTPTGMAESAIEFLKICREQSFHQVAISMKASNTMIMVQATRLLVDKMMEMNSLYPLHLGVTEAGEGEDGRIKSAAGIGALLIDGIGDTIRVSLTEDPEEEIPVARILVNYMEEKKKNLPVEFLTNNLVNPFDYSRRETKEAGQIGNKKAPVVFITLSSENKINEDVFEKIGWKKSGEQWEFKDQNADGIFISSDQSGYDFPENKTIVLDYSSWLKVNEKKNNILPVLEPEEYLNGKNLPDKKFIKLGYSHFSEKLIEKLKMDEGAVIIAVSDSKHGLYGQRAIIFNLINSGCKNPVILKNEYEEVDEKVLQVKSACDLGVFFLDGLADGIWVDNKRKIGLKKIIATSFGILQATRSRITKTEYISCPSCGRTNFNIMETAAGIRKKTSHLKGLKIAIMGCIVNGVGEMADADYGYVGAGKGKITLYKAKEIVKKNIPESEAVEELISLIKENGDWIEPK